MYVGQEGRSGNCELCAAMFGMECSGRGYVTIENSVRLIV